jgi:hypothetical protein
MKIILFTNARDEKHIKEWIAHHLNLEFDHIYVFDHKSKISIETLLKPNNKITIQYIDYDKELLKEHLMMEAKKIALDGKYNWMMYIDADEFLILNHYSTIHEFMKQYIEFNQIGINELFFGTNYLTKEPNGMILENYVRCSKKIGIQLKPIVRPESIIKPSTPHIFTTKNMKKSVNYFTKTQLNEVKPYAYTLTEDYSKLPAYIAHYDNQAYEVYISRKIKLPRDDNSAYRNQLSEECLHSINNDQININIRDKYCERNRKLLDLL